MSGPYAASALDYWRGGHRGTLPLPPGQKLPPPTGFTGWGGRWPSMADVAGWVEDHPDGNIALRLDEETLGVDVDAYGAKKGGETLAGLEAELGPLPPTISSTSRGFDTSRIRLYKVPAGHGWRDDLEDIELIHYGHRYVVAWPSIHPDTGDTYEWYDHNGEPSQAVPDFARLPELPDAWVEYLSKGETGGTAKADADLGELQAWYKLLKTGDPCEPVEERKRQAIDALLAGRGSRHNVARGAVSSLIGYGANGHRGVVDAVTQTRDLFYLKAGQPGPDQRTTTGAQGEWQRMVTGAIRMQIAEHPRPDEACNCVVGKVIIGGTKPAKPTWTTTARAPAEQAAALEAAHEIAREGFGAEYDLDVLDVVMSTAASEQLPGIPAWLLVVGGSGATKTETVSPLKGVGAHSVSTLTGPAALLSGTPPKQRSKGATGGLLRKVGDTGLLVVKDVTSILSMHRDTRAEIIAALREVADGRWDRDLGEGGGRTLTWEGRVVVIGAVTTAWDQAHAVIAAMGDRFPLIRLDSTGGRKAAGRKAASNTGLEAELRQKLTDAVTRVLEGMNPDGTDLTTDETERLLDAADLVTRARTAVVYDYRGEVIDAHAPEMPTRFMKHLVQIVRGAVAIGVERNRALELGIRVARDSMPPIRLAIIDDVAANPDSTPTDIRRRTDKPWTTVDRQCKALHMLGVLTVDEVEELRAGKTVTRWFYKLADGIDPKALVTRYVPPHTHIHDLEEREEPSPYPPSDKPGDGNRFVDKGLFETTGDAGGTSQVTGESLPDPL
jgi:hypothetical protein